MVMGIVMRLVMVMVMVMVMVNGPTSSPADFLKLGITIRITHHVIVSVGVYDWAMAMVMEMALLPSLI